jgi:signal transduction histidine kinase
MRFGQRIRGPKRIALLFVVVTLAPMLTLGWLGWMLIAQEKELEQNRLRDGLDSRAGKVAAALERHMDDALEQLPDPSQGAAPIPDNVVDAVSVAFNAQGIQAKPAGRLPYYPAPPVPEHRVPDALFATGDRLELQSHAYTDAIASFRPLLTNVDPAIRAHALIGIVRNYRNLGQFDRALRVTRELEQLGPIPVDGMPADLIALMDRCKILARTGRSAELALAAKEVDEGLARGRWALDRDTYVTHGEEARDLFPEPGQGSTPSPEQLALAAAAERLWRLWQENPAVGRSSGWQSIRVSTTPPGLSSGDSSVKGAESRPVLLLWRKTPAGLSAIAAGPRYIESQWGRAWTEQGVRALFVDADQGHVLGDPIPGDVPSGVRRVGDTRLPWTITVADDGSGASASPADARRPWLLPAALMTMLLITLAGAGLTVRALAHEFGVARQQSDFVAAVSHEFRTPLTSLRHLTELLSTGVVTSEERRRQYYDVMTRETSRLHRMVEGLLSFGRMTALGRRATFEPVDPVELTEQTVADFRTGPDVNRHEVEMVGGMAPRTSLVHANREALSRAVRNLLENAVKYSPNVERVEVGVARDGRHVAIHVRDQGVGIAREEQRKVFETFSRGSASQALNVPGSGIGLAMARQIVDAHDGEVLLESSPGRGTTVTIRLPVMPGETA